MAGHFVVTVEAYSLEPGAVGKTLGTTYTSRHSSPREAGKRLASLISGRTELSKSVRRGLRAGRTVAVSGRYIVVTPSGDRWSLRQLRDWLAMQ